MTTRQRLTVVKAKKKSRYRAALVLGAAAVAAGLLYPAGEASATTVTTDIVDPSRIDIGDISIPLDCGTPSMSLSYTTATTTTLATLSVSTINGASGAFSYGGSDFVVQVAATSSTPGHIASATGTTGDPEILGTANTGGSNMGVTMSLTFYQGTSCTPGTQKCVMSTTSVPFSGITNSDLTTPSTSDEYSFGADTEGTVGLTGSCNCVLNALAGSPVYAYFALVVP